MTNHPIKQITNEVSLFNCSRGLPYNKQIADNYAVYQYYWPHKQACYTYMLALLFMFDKFCQFHFWFIFHSSIIVCSYSFIALMLWFVFTCKVNTIIIKCYTQSNYYFSEGCQYNIIIIQEIIKGYSIGKKEEYQYFSKYVKH